MNLTYKHFNTERVMRWRLIIEEYGADLQYVPGKKNIVADALSRLDISEDELSALTPALPVRSTISRLRYRYPRKDTLRPVYCDDMGF